jgi:hypothetical protein
MSDTRDWYLNGSNYVTCKLRAKNRRKHYVWIYMLPLFPCMLCYHVGPSVTLYKSLKLRITLAHSVFFLQTLSLNSQCALLSSFLLFPSLSRLRLRHWSHVKACPVCLIFLCCLTTVSHSYQIVLFHACKMLTMATVLPPTTAVFATARLSSTAPRPVFRHRARGLTSQMPKQLPNRFVLQWYGVDILVS